MEKIPAILTIIISLFMASRSSWLIYKKKIQLSFSTWFLFAIAATMGLVSYLQTENHNIWNNMINVTDLFTLWSIVLVLYFFNSGVDQLIFDSFEMECLSSAWKIFMFWVISSDPFTVNLSIQVLLTIGYFPTIRKLWLADENTESFSVWIAGFFMCCLSLYLPLKNFEKQPDILSITYSIRAIIMTFLVVALMLRVKFRTQKA